MKSKIIVFALLIIVVGFFLFRKNSEKPVIVTENTEDIVGCYIAKLGQDVYSLNIRSANEDGVFGNLIFDNYQKDSSSGSFSGSYNDGILFGEYSFHSEGMFSVIEVIFKKTENGFQRGFGPTDDYGVSFSDMSMIEYDNIYEFIKTDAACPESL